MANCSDNADLSLETDHISITATSRDDTEKFAARNSDAKIDFTKHVPPPPESPTFKVDSGKLSQSDCLYQCAGADSGSDSAAEENSPCGSPGNEKHEAFVPSGGDISGQKGRPRTSLATSATERCKELAESNHQVQQSTDVHVFQCSIARKNSGSESDLGKEEDIPPNHKRSEALAVSGQRHTDCLPPVLYPPKPQVLTASSHQSSERRIPRQIHNSSSYRAEDEDLHKDKQDILERLETFFNTGRGWPHQSPSAYRMAVAGFIYKGSYEVKENDGAIRVIHDWVECCRCRKSMHSFDKDDDPEKEHRKLHGGCP